VAPDEALALERKNHLMDGRWSDGEPALDVGFGGRLEIDACVGVDEGQILALLGCEAGFLSARHLIHLWIHLRLDQEAQMNVRFV
jgi:hypothetical protein